MQALPPDYKDGEYYQPPSGYNHLNFPGEPVIFAFNCRVAQSLSFLSEQNIIKSWER